MSIILRQSTNLLIGIMLLGLVEFSFATTVELSTLEQSTLERLIQIKDPSSRVDEIDNAFIKASAIDFRFLENEFIKRLAQLRDSSCKIRKATCSQKVNWLRLVSEKAIPLPEFRTWWTIVFAKLDDQEKIALLDAAGTRLAKGQKNIIPFIAEAIYTAGAIKNIQVAEAYIRNLETTKGVGIDLTLLWSAIRFKDLSPAARLRAVYFFKTSLPEQKDLVPEEQHQIIADLMTEMAVGLVRPDLVLAFFEKYSDEIGKMLPQRKQQSVLSFCIAARITAAPDKCGMRLSQNNLVTATTKIELALDKMQLNQVEEILKKEGVLSNPAKASASLNPWLLYYAAQFHRLKGNLSAAGESLSVFRKNASTDQLANIMSEIERAKILNLGGKTAEAERLLKETRIKAIANMGQGSLPDLLIAIDLYKSAVFNSQTEAAKKLGLEIRQKIKDPPNGDLYAKVIDYADELAKTKSVDSAPPLNHPDLEDVRQLAMIRFAKKK